MLTLHPTNRHSARAPCSPVVTGSSRGLKGQSSSSESARSTTTPGWRHWFGKMLVSDTWVLLCVCDCEKEGVCVVFMCITILIPVPLVPNLEFQKCKGARLSYLCVYFGGFTYIVDVRNVIFVNSNCLLNGKQFKNHTSSYCFGIDIIIDIMLTVLLPQPAS